MTERETEHVRMVDAGRLRAAYAPMSSSEHAFASVRAAKFQCLAHGNTYGFSFVSMANGFSMTVSDSFEESCVDFVKRKQIAMDHGQNATHVDLKPLPTHREVTLSSIAYNLALSQDELHLAVAYGDQLAVYEVAELYHSSTPVPLHTYSNILVEEIAWSSESANSVFAVLTTGGQVVVYSTDGSKRDVALSASASSVCWSPSGESLAVGLTNSELEVFDQASLESTRTINAPDCCEGEEFVVHHVNWAEDGLILAGFRKYDEEQEETTAFACLFESDAWLELDEVVAFYDVENRAHQYYSVFLADWRMFFIGCSLSADVELLVSDPESGEWEIWKPSEKYQARLPMNAQDEESFPLGLALNFNSSSPVDVDETMYAPAPLVSCTTTEGVLVNFAFIDMTVLEELPFIQKPEEFKASTSRKASPKPVVQVAPSIEEEDKHAYGKNDENEFAEGSDDDDSDDEEARAEEAETARNAFHTVAGGGATCIPAADFPKLFKVMRSTYSDEEHGKYQAKLTKDGKVYEADFVEWYVGWIMGDDESDNESEDESSSLDQSAKPAMKSKAEIANALAKFKPAEGSWKCDECMVTNPDPKAQKCVSCGTANPAAPKLVPAPMPAFSTTAGSGSSVGIGSGGFNFPGAGATGAASSGGGFSFSSAEKTDGGPSTTTGGFSFSFGGKAGADSSADQKAPVDRFAFKPAAATESKPASKEPVKEEEDKHAYGKNDENEFAEGSDDDDSDDEEARAEEAETARNAFHTVAGGGATCIPAADFPKLFKVMRSTYSDEEHGKYQAKLTKDGKVYEADFVEWYVGWIMGDDESDNESEDESSSLDQSAKPAMKSKAEIANALAKFKPAEGSWKCDECMVTNPDPKAQKCVSCGTANPAAPKLVPAPMPAFSTTAGSGSSVGIGSGGFNFPGAGATGAASSGGGFSFSSAEKTDGGPSTTTGGFSFSFGGKAGADSSADQKAPVDRFAFKPAATTTNATGATTTTQPSSFAFASTPKKADSSYPPDTSTKPKPPAFGGASTGGYPPDTSTKPKPPAFGGASTGGYPPDTSTKPKPPAFGGASTGGYPPDTSTKPKPPAFTSVASQGSDKSAIKTEQSSFSFGSSFGGSLFGSKTESGPTSTGALTSLFGKPAAAKSLFGTVSTKTDADKPSQPSPFGVVPKSDTKNSFSLSSTPSTSSSGASTSKFPAKPAVASSDAKSSTSVKVSTSEAGKGGKATPKTVLEGQLWKLIIDFDKSFQRIKRNSQSIQSEDKKFSDQVTSQLRKLQNQVSSLCDDINSLDDSRDQIEKDVLFVIGSDGDVHEQLEYGREILASFKDETLKRSLEEQPLDQRSEETRQTLKDKLDEVERSCVDLENHVASTKLGSSGMGGSTGLNSAVSTAHLFRVLKQTYDNSKLQYNKVSSLAQQMDDLTLGSERMLQSTRGNSTAVFEATVPFIKSKVDMAELITEAEQRSQDVRQHFLSLCNNVITPRDVSSAPRRKLTASSASGASSPLRIKAYSKLMPKTQLTVASPMSTTKSTSNSVSFKGTEVKSGSRLFSLAEDKASKEPAKFIQTPQRPKPSVGQAPERPAIGGFGITSSSSKPEPKAFGSDSSAPKPSAFGFGASSTSQPAKFSLPSSGGTSFSLDSESKSSDQDSKRARNATPFGSAPAVSVKPKPAATSEVGKKEPSTQSTGAFGFGSDFGTQLKDLTSDKPSVTTSFSAPSSATNHKTLLTKFYEEYNPSKVSEAEKTLAGFVGREEELFSRLFTKYIPDSKPEDVKKFLSGGPLPKKPSGFGATSAAATDSSKPAFSPFGAAKPAASTEDASKKPSPFGTVSTSGFGAAAAKPASTTTAATGFGTFGSFGAATGTGSASASASPFGQPAADHRQRLVDFYTKHNPAKLGDVDATLAKYKGNEEKLFQNLATKYKTAPGGVPSSPAIQPAKAGAAASPFGNAGTFSSISLSGNAQPSTGFGATGSFGGGFGTKPAAPSSSPFGAAPQTSSPFGAPSTTSAANPVGGFGSSSPGGFGAPSTLGSGGFGAGGGAGAGGFGTANQFGNAGGAFGSTGSSEHREKLIKFYQQFNPEKLKDVDSTLEKYKGQESRLFAMLEQKYLGKPATPAASTAFGVASAPSFGGGFGAPSALGAGASATPMFGSSSALGGPAAQPAFGGSTQPAFGAPSAFGAAARTPVAGGFGVQPAAASGAQSAGTGFSSFSTQGASFGGFGAQTGSTGGFGNAGGGGFGSGATQGGFSQFGNSSSFTQMRS